ncbi:cyclase family protein [Amycolatopsis sp. NPDC049688]|uniref:cyclase family protein n=1 Tax=Amycolatopsis sp. NPDC049688 TaxID=3154733 RepID=UPI003422BFBF
MGPKTSRVVDLTHAFGPDVAGSEDFAGERREQALSLQRDGFDLQRHHIPGAWATHVDAPAHMRAGGRTVDQLRPDELVLPLVVIDLSAEVARDPGTCLDVPHILDWERRYGQVPRKAFVAFRSDWSNRWPSQDAMRGREPDGRVRSPGWTVAAIDFLVGQRDTTAFGHETIDTDPGRRVTSDAGGSDAEEVAGRQHPAEARIFEHNRYQVEMLAALSEVPPLGATVVVGVGKARSATAFPARVLALVPDA